MSRLLVEFLARILKRHLDLAHYVQTGFAQRLSAIPQEMRLASWPWECLGCLPRSRPLAVVTCMPSRVRGPRVPGPRVRGAPVYTARWSAWARAGAQILDPHMSHKRSIAETAGPFPGELGKSRDSAARHGPPLSQNPSSNL